jgi:hypothetical protein
LQVVFPDPATSPSLLVRTFGLCPRQLH